LGGDHDRRPVRVVGADEVHHVPLHALVPHPDVGLDVFHDVADVELAVGVGQGGGDEELALGHGAYFRGEPDILFGMATLCGTGRQSFMATQEQLLAALAGLKDPNTGKDFVSTKAVKNVQVEGGDVSFDVELGYPAKSQVPELRRALVAAAKSAPGVDNVSVNITTRVQPHAVQRGVQLMPNVKNIIAVASGKGG